MRHLIEMFRHAATDPHREVCGLVVKTPEGRLTAVKGTNVALQPQIHSDLDPSIWVEVADKGYEVVASYHSHPNGIVTPSPADLTTCEASGYPMFIVNGENRRYHYLQPTGYKAPYLKRPYVLGVLDCYVLIRDWYEGELGIVLGKYDTSKPVWREGVSMYLNHFKEEGFIELQDTPPQHGDLFFMQVDSKVPNHAAIWLKNNTILHHVSGTLSGTSPWVGSWVAATTHHVRHHTLHHG